MSDCRSRRFFRLFRCRHFLPLILLVSVWSLACLPWLVGRTFTNGDNVAFFFPNASFVISSLRHGRMPWWNPYLYGGQPVLGDPQNFIVSPHTIIGLLLGNYFNLRVFDVTSLSCLLCGGLALYVYGQAAGRRRLWPLLGAMVFMFGGVAMSRLQHVSELLSYSLLPIVLLAVRAVCDKPSLLRATAFSAICAMTLLNPNQVVFLSAIGLCPFLLLHGARSSRRAKAALLICGAVVVALAVASPVIDAMLEFVQISNRSELPLQASAGFSFALLHLPGFALPGLFGMSSAGQPTWSPTDADLDYLYVGIVPSCLFVWSFIRLPTLHAQAFLSVLMAVFFFIFALGTNGSLYPFLFHHLPGQSGFRRPADGAFLVNFYIALSVAIFRPSDSLFEANVGSIRLRRPGVLGDRGSVVVACALFAIVFIVLFRAMTALGSYAHARSHESDLLTVVENGSVRAAIFVTLMIAGWRLHGKNMTRVIPALLFTLTGADLCSAGRFNPVHLLPYADSIVARVYRQARPQPPALPYADSVTQPLLDTIAFLRSHRSADDPSGSRIEAIGGGLALTMPETQGLFSTQGYNPIVLKTYADVIGTQALTWEPKAFRPASPNYTSQAYHSLGLRYVLFDRWSMQTGNGPPGVAPRIAALRAALQAEMPAAVRPLRTIGAYEIWELLDSYPRAALLQDKGRPRACTIPKYRNTWMTVRCQADRSSTLVIGDNDAPGWSACVNGSAARISLYKGFLRSIQIPAGDDTITLRYQPVPFLRNEACS